ncbi:GntR family transcriptional regulator [Defluviimonas sp. SAOS-178_SWC]|uniref:GntR family transcriptional regulator n=1 Tax=Defluviimonas sp. SAOS-178_SWC TaxID=3121287 RepID=UPI0032218E5C
MHPQTDTGLVGHEVYAAIRRHIIFGRLDAGTRLRLERMKAEYGASVSTIREALNRLTSEGLVEAEGQRGFSVAPMSDANLREIADLRILLECHALALSIGAGDTEWEGAIVSAHHKLHRMEERMAAGDVSVRETWKQYDWEFHQALILACGSTALLEAHGTVFDKYLRYQMRRLTYRGATAAREHRALLDAALDRDTGRAQTILRAHIEGGVADSLRSAAE